MDDLNHINLLKERFQTNVDQISQLQTENGVLQSHFTKNNSLILTSFEERWTIMHAFLMQLVTTQCRYIYDTAPSLSNCRILIMITTRPFHKYQWHLVLPEEQTGGKHFKVINLTDRAAYFNSTLQDSFFIDYLSEKRLVEKLILINN